MVILYSGNIATVNSALISLTAISCGVFLPAAQNSAAHMIGKPTVASTKTSPKRPPSAGGDELAPEDRLRIGGAEESAPVDRLRADAHGPSSTPFYATNLEVGGSVFQLIFWQ